MARPAMPNKETLRINVPGDLGTELRALAARHDRPVSEMVRVLIKEAVSKS